MQILNTYSDSLKEAFNKGKIIFWQKINLREKKDAKFKFKWDRKGYSFGIEIESWNHTWKKNQNQTKKRSQT